MSTLKITTPGLMTSIQDRGRTGYLRYGVPECGALDQDSLRLANALVGNEQDTATIEIRYLGPSFVVNATHVRAAISGAGVKVSIVRGDETRYINQDRTFSLHAGDRVSIGPLRDSTTAYLAVEGGFAIDEILGSVSTDLKSSIGGWNGGNILAGTVLPLNVDCVPSSPDLSIPTEGYLVFT